MSNNEQEIVDVSFWRKEDPELKITSHKKVLAVLPHGIKKMRRQESNKESYTTVSLYSALLNIIIMIA